MSVANLLSNQVKRTLSSFQTLNNIELLLDQQFSTEKETCHWVEISKKRISKKIHSFGPTFNPRGVGDLICLDYYQISITSSPYPKNRINNVCTLVPSILLYKAGWTSSNAARRCFPASPSILPKPGYGQLPTLPIRPWYKNIRLTWLRLI